ncbi:hypothetical protein D3C72_1044000 [compost metagenome]
MHAVVGGQPCARQHGGGNIGRGAQRLAARGSWQGLRITPDERRADQALVVDGAFEQQLVVAEEVTVVAGEDDHGVVVQARVAQRLHDAADGGVDMADGTVVQRNRLPRFAFGAGEHGRCVLDGHVQVALPIQPRHVRGWLMMGGPAGVKRCRQRHIVRPILVPILARRRVGMMRIGE